MNADGDRERRPIEMPATNTTIVGGRPPGSGRPVGAIPRGIEVLIKKASVDAAFRMLLLANRADAAKEIGLKLTATEAQMINLVPAEQLELMIAQTKVEPSHIPAFMGKAAAIMLVAVGAAVLVVPTHGTLGIQPGEGSRAIGPEVPAATTQATNPATQPAPDGGPSRGIRPDLPATQPSPTQPQERRE